MHWPTHAVTNQTPPLADYNLFETDTVLTTALKQVGAGWHAAALSRLGAKLGTAEVQQLGEQANQHPPELTAFSPQGERINRVEFHPAWHQLLTSLRGEALHALPWAEPQPGAMAARAAGFYLHGQIEAGSLCPVTMTFASIPVLAKQPALFEPLRDKLFSREHDPRDAPLADKRSMLIGMGMTEKQGGSDVRSNTTAATPSADGYTLVGHKWFFSVPTSDAHLVLAKVNGSEAPSCFFVPRYRPDGRQNAVHIQRLKDKVGNRSNASSEVEFYDAYGVLVGDEGRGIPTIIEMATYTRLDCVIGSAALMRQALVQAIHHTRHRQAFGHLLAEQPLMRQVLADLALESEAAAVLMMRLAQAFDAADAPLERALQRWLLPAAKFWVCKRAIEMAGECMEVLGGNGYVETGPLARLYREAPVNSIWEGSGNVMCLDVQRAYAREPEAAQALLAWLHQHAHGDITLNQALEALHADLALANDAKEAAARRIAQSLMLLTQACLLKQQAASSWVAEAFIASRFGHGHGRVFGTLPDRIGRTTQQALLKRAFPQ
jgi:putative acyl-CoA dehydrogenase